MNIASKYLFYVWNRNTLFKKLFSILFVCKKITSLRGSVYLRSQSDMEWLITYIPYLISPDYTDTLLSGLDSHTQSQMLFLIEKIKTLTQYEIVNYNDMFCLEERQLSSEFANYIRQYGSHQFAITEFYYQRLQSKYSFNLNHRDILDFGACEGDTSICATQQRTESKVYAFEPESYNFSLLNANIQAFGLEGVVIPVKKGVGKCNDVMKINGSGAGASFKEGEGDIEIEITTIDDFVIQQGLTPGLMKWDIEGMEYDSIVGAEQTIKQFKPILLISIYHTGKDFFEIKPLIESWDLGYQFALERQHSSHPFADTLLICY